MSAKPGPVCYTYQIALKQTTLPPLSITWFWWMFFRDLLGRAFPLYKSDCANSKWRRNNSEYCFTSLSTHWGLCLTLIMNDPFIVHSTIDSTVHSIPLNSLEHCICTTTMTNIRPDRDLNLVPPGYKPWSIRMSHRGRHETTVCRVT